MTYPLSAWEDSRSSSDSLVTLQIEQGPGGSLRSGHACNQCSSFLHLKQSPRGPWIWACRQLGLVLSLKCCSQILALEFSFKFKFYKILLFWFCVSVVKDIECHIEEFTIKGLRATGRQLEFCLNIWGCLIKYELRRITPTGESGLTSMNLIKVSVRWDVSSAGFLSSFWVNSWILCQLSWFWEICGDVSGCIPTFELYA